MTPSPRGAAGNPRHSLNYYWCHIDNAPRCFRTEGRCVCLDRINHNKETPKAEATWPNADSIAHLLSPWRGACCTGGAHCANWIDGRHPVVCTGNHQHPLKPFHIDDVGIVRGCAGDGGRNACDDRYFFIQMCHAAFPSLWRRYKHCTTPLVTVARRVLYWRCSLRSLPDGYGA